MSKHNGTKWILCYIILNQNDEDNVDLHTNQIVIGFDPKQLSEVAKGQWCICFQTKIWEVMCWC